MNIHEYQAKELLKGYGVAVLEGHIAWTPEEAEAAARKLPGPVTVIKSQIHAGGRGAGKFEDAPEGKGGVRIAKTPEEARAAAEAMIGHTLITKQTGPAGRRVSRVYVEAGCDIKRELYLSSADRPRHLARHHHGLDRGRDGDRGGRRASSRENSSRRRRSGFRHLGFSLSSSGVSRSAWSASSWARSRNSSRRCIAPSSISTAPSLRSTRWW